MKLLRNVGTTTKAILLAGLLGACQTENDSTLAPQASANVSDKNAKTVNIPRLIKDGENELQYVADGLGRQVLSKVIDHGANKYYKYTYSVQSVVEDQFQLGTDKPLGQVIYKLNANGKCNEMIIGGKTFILEYNADGQLAKRYNKNSANERIEFEYLQDSNANSKSLDKMTFFTAGNAKIREVSFHYHYSGEPVKLDLMPLNPKYLDCTTRYLPIFGKFNTFLLRISNDNWIASGGIDQNFVYYYSLSAEGLPTLIDQSIFGGNGFTTTVQRKYFSPLAGQ